MVNETDIHGVGLSFPLRRNSRGGLKRSAQAQKIGESIRIILGTARGERLMRPNFGSALRSLVFAPNNPATANLARHYVEEALRLWEPRIILREVTADNDHRKNCLRISISYTIKATSEPQNLVYPFYLEQP